MPHADRKSYHARALATGPQVVTLVEEAKAGSPAAFEQLVTLFQKDIFRGYGYKPEDMENRCILIILMV